MSSGGTIERLLSTTELLKDKLKHIKVFKSLFKEAWFKLGNSKSKVLGRDLNTYPQWFGSPTPQNVHSLIFRTCEYVAFQGKRDSTDIINV